MSAPIPASRPATNGDLSADIRQLENALAACAVQVDDKKHCQEQHDVKNRNSSALS
ncbi:phage lysis protein [Serratia marcescens]|uniref:Phage lysis protein n=1 Tax=Serratia marcescens TaxID=615 RepID=A0A939SUP1_SERMA|nr:phage lysis protein [Serratia marcescens]